MGEWAGEDPGIKPATSGPLGRGEKRLPSLFTIRLPAESEHHTRRRHGKTQECNQPNPECGQKLSTLCPSALTVPLSGVWRYRASTGTGWPGVNIL